MKTYSEAYATYTELINERTEWEAEWKQISLFLLPGRGIYSHLSKPTKRKLTSPKVINTVAEDSLYVLTSGMHGGLTSPSRPWFKLDWADPSLNELEQLKMWLQQCEETLHDGLHASNFYSTINSFYIEYAGFGTGSMYVGHDTGDDYVPFRFELLTAGEFVFSVGPDGKPDQYFRVVFMTERQFVGRFNDAASDQAKKRVENNDPNVDGTYVTVLECLKKTKKVGKSWARCFFTVHAVGSQTSVKKQKNEDPIAEDSFYEFPYPTARWGTIGSDTLGIGPGSRALPDIKRLQEMERAFLMATHKTIDPPLNVPARMRGKTNTLPGGYNYYANPNETINELYQVRFDFNGVSAAVERVEQRIQRNFFNDIFLTAARDPNATPYKATEVNAREQEKMLRLGPVIERLQHEFLQPVVERCFNIMLRKGMFPELAPELEPMVGDFRINLVSPLATAQRSVAIDGINSFMAFIGNAAQFTPEIIDNIDIDEAAREYGDITGVRLGILRTQEDVDAMRKQRQQQQAQQQQAEAQAQAETVRSDVQNTDADTRKTLADAAVSQMDAAARAEEIGM